MEDLLEFRREAEGRIVRRAYDLALARLGADIFTGSLRTHDDKTDAVARAEKDLEDAIKALTVSVLADARLTTVEGMSSLIAQARSTADADG